MISRWPRPTRSPSRTKRSDLTPAGPRPATPLQLERGDKDEYGPGGSAGASFFDGLHGGMIDSFARGADDENRPRILQRMFRGREAEIPARDARRPAGPGRVPA